MLILYVTTIRFIYLEDLMRFMKEDEASKTMCLIQSGTETKGISKRALKNWAVSMKLCQFSVRKEVHFFSRLDQSELISK